MECKATYLERLKSVQRKVKLARLEKHGGRQMAGLDAPGWICRIAASMDPLG